MDDPYTDRFEIHQPTQYIQTMVHEDPAHISQMTDKRLKAHTGFKIG